MKPTPAQRSHGLFRQFRHAPWRTIRRRLLSRDAPAPPKPQPTPAEYERWLRGRIADRAARFTRRAAPGQFSFLTGVYSGTSAGIFRETAASVAAQDSHEFEWVILAHGPVDDELHSELAVLEKDVRVRIVRIPENLGIIGGMKRLLAEATGRFVIPLDADDLLTPDALTVLASAVHDRPALFLYSDEDSLVQGRPRSPYLRPDWDPLLNLSCSYIFHLVALDRRTAAGLDIYADDRANYCHDWNSVMRFTAAGHVPLHVAEVLYHWRAHPASHTNTAGPHQGSIASQRFVLDRFLAARPDLGRFEIAPFPLNRGAHEWWLWRKHEDPVPAELITIGPARPAPGGDFAFARTKAIGDVASFARAVGKSESEVVFVVHGKVAPAGAEWFWEATGLFELHPDLAIIAGRVINPDRIVLGGPERVDADGEITCPYRGMLANEPGEMAMALKPHTVEVAGSAFFAARTDFLKAVIFEIPAVATPATLGFWLSVAAKRRAMRVGCSPLLSADAEPGFDCLTRLSDQERALYRAAQQ
jgi:glycosyltransferase involved in cell wall biosynthesis